MKASFLQRRQEISFDEPVHIAPSDTTHEHLQRVEEWTQKSTTAPPSNKKHSSKDQGVHDLEAKSQLIAEAVQLMDSRDKQTRTRTHPAVATNNIQHQVDAIFYDNDSDSDENDKSKRLGSQEGAIGKHFRESNQSARNYIKHFENKMTQKKAYEEAISNTFPSIKSKKDLLKGVSAINAPVATVKKAKPVVEPASWRFKASRSVKFSVMSGSQQKVLKDDEGSEQGDKWTTKQENDPDWWRWKLKQRFLQNDELLHKLEAQRHKLESAMVQGENNRNGRNPVFNNKIALNQAASPEHLSIVATIPTIRNSSWHVGVEIPSHMAPSTSPSTSNKRSSTYSAHKQQMQVMKAAREPIPSFYTPSQKVVSAIMDNDNPSAKSVTAVRQKLKVLKKDPYLSKLLAGNEMFRPEMMLDSNQQNENHQLSQQYKGTGATNGNNVRRKLSLESLTDTDDDVTAAKFFNPDVKVLYERLSEMEMINNEIQEKSKLIELNSREPSDGFLNLPILLETGRFNRYNKLPSMKLIESINKDVTAKQQAKKSEKSNKLQSVINKIKKNNNLANIKFAHAPISDGGATTTPGTASNQNQGKLEDLPTTEWAKKLMSTVKKQDMSTKMDDDGNAIDNIHKVDEINDILKLKPRKYKVPADQETNMLYHEILMSKWKKDKHNKEKDVDTGKANKQNSNVKWKRTAAEHGHDNKKIDEDLDRPRGLDIWLENIREKAKRDKLISPLPNNGDTTKINHALTSLSSGKTTVKTLFEVQK